MNNDDFPEIVIDSVPVPYFISDSSKQSIAQSILVQRIKGLNRFGVNIIGIACNTVHVLYPVLLENSKSPIVSMVDAVSRKAFSLRYKKVGLFASPTTIRTNLYQQSLEKHQIKVFYPSAKIQTNLEKIIRDTVSGRRLNINAKYLLKTAKKFIKDNHLDGLILGCTELPLIFPKDKLKVIDCLEVLADELLNVKISS